MANKSPKAPTAAVITMGCSKNRVDSEHLATQLEALGYRVLPEPSLFKGADLDLQGLVDVLIINTCGFIQDAKQESINMILEAADAKMQGKVGKLYVFGCLSARYAPELAPAIPEVDAFFGANVFDSPTGNALLAALGGRAWQPELNTRRLLSTPGHYAYLKLSEGCNRRCAYCAIPHIRGKHQSRPQEALLQEARTLVEGGVKELVLIAQDTSYYGLDLYGKRSLAKLMESLCDIEGLHWIRVLYAYPQRFPLEVLDLMASEKKICHYLDIPLQHVSDKVLEAMRRDTTGAETRALIEAFRKRVPDICLRTTLMVGHPGEDRKAFEELLAFVQEARFERLGAFQYCEEEGTYGASHLRDSVTRRTKQNRYARLMELQQGISLAYNQSRVGKEYEVLVDSAAEGCLLGRSRYEAPEVDGLIRILPPAEGPAPRPGDLVRVRITEAGEYDLISQTI